MGNHKEDDRKKGVSRLGRRDLMKLGARAGVAVAGVLTAPAAFSQQGQAPPPPTAGLDQAPSLRVQHFPDITDAIAVDVSSKAGRAPRRKR